MSTQIDIKTSSGIITIRGLKHGEVKRLRLRERVADVTNAADLQEEVLRIVLTEQDYDKLDDLYEYEVTDIFTKIMDHTFMSEGLRKNWSWQWDSTMPDTSTAPPAKEQENKNN